MPNYEEKYNELFADDTDAEAKDARWINRGLILVVLFFALLPLYHSAKGLLFLRWGAETEAVITTVERSDRPGFTGNSGAGSSHRVTEHKARISYVVDGVTLHKKKSVSSKDYRGDRLRLTYFAPEPRWIYWGEQRRGLWQVLYLHKLRGWFMWAVAALAWWMLWAVVTDDENDCDVSAEC